MRKRRMIEVSRRNGATGFNCEAFCIAKSHVAMREGCVGREAAASQVKGLRRNGATQDGEPRSKPGLGRLSNLLRCGRDAP